MIYDGFIFFNELDMLEIRLHTLASRVNRFILVESDLTIQGDPKPLFYEENKARFSEFHDRISHVIVSDMPSGNDSWAREFHQRNCIMRGISEVATDSDVLLVSDVDEIPNLSNFIESTPTPCSWEVTMCYYYVNMLTSVCDWKGVVAVSLKVLRDKYENSPQCVRNNRESVPVFSKNKGWHFSYLGGINGIKTKLESFSHAEFRHRANSSIIEKAITEDWKNGVDVLGRPMGFEKRDDLRFLPEYLRINKERFRHLFCP